MASERKKIAFLLTTYIILASVCAILGGAIELRGLSTMLGTTTTMLGTTTTMLGTTTTMLGTTTATLLGTTTTMVANLASFSGALMFGQLFISLLAIGILSIFELTDPSHGRFKKVVGEMRRAWSPAVTLLVITFILIVASRMYTIING